MKIARLWLARLALVAFIFLLPECAVRVLLPHRGLTFIESVARDENLREAKGTHERRIFVIGASSMMGYHHFGQSSLSQALAFVLKESSPMNAWKVVTFAKAGEGSSFVFETARESLQYQPDLLLLYTGENEFSPIPVFRRKWRYRFESQLLKWKMFRVGRELAGHSPWPSVPNFNQLNWNEVYDGARQNRDRIVADFVRTGSSFLKNRPEWVATVFLYPVLSPPSGPAFWNQLEKWDLDWSRPETHHFVRGLLAAAARDHISAIRYYEKAGGLESSFVLVPQYLSLSLAAIGRTREASIAKQRALELDLLPTQIPLNSYKEALTGTQASTVLALGTLLADRLKAHPLPNNLIEDGIHPTVHLEFEEARLILSNPLVRQAINYSGNPYRIFFEQYAQAMNLNASFFAKVYCRVGQYLIRDEAGETALQKALTFSPGDPQVLEAQQTYRKQAAARNALHKRVLAEWQSQLNKADEETR